MQGGGIAVRKRLPLREEETIVEDGAEMELRTRGGGERERMDCGSNWTYADSVFRQTYQNGEVSLNF